MSLRILAIDIETVPNLAYVWRLWQTDVSPAMLVKAHEVLCLAAKWVGEPEVFFMPSERLGVPLKEEMLAQVHALMDEADAVMHWNGTKFDIPHLNREFLLAGMKPPSPVAQIDLMLVAKKHFRFPSNKLEHVAEALGIGKKKQTGGFKLWLDCMAGDEKAWATMEKYNKQDVLLLEEAYNKLLPWVHSGPNRNLFDEKGCPVCGSAKIQKRGMSRTKASSYQRYQCMDCGAWFRDTKRAHGGDFQLVVR